MFFFVILDDDTLCNINMNKSLEKIFNKYEMDSVVALNATEPREVIEYCSRNSSRNNIYLLDVDIKNSINGIDVAGIIREIDANAYIVFISAHPEYIMPSLKTKVFDYLIKPVAIETLTKCINSIHRDFLKIHNKVIKSIAIKSGFNIYNLSEDEIAYFEKYGHVLVVHTISGQIESSESLENIQNKIDKNKFFRCHKSYIVNILHISKIDFSNNIVYLKNGESCIVSKRCKKELKSICGII